MKYRVFNPSLLEVVFGLQDFARVIRRASARSCWRQGEERLPFFFPQMRIHGPASGDAWRNSTSLGRHAFRLRRKSAGRPTRKPGSNRWRTQMVSSLGRIDLFRKAKEHSDATFSYELYEALDLKDRWTVPKNHRSQGTDSESQWSFMAGGYKSMLDGVYPERSFFTGRHRLPFEPSWRGAAKARYATISLSCSFAQSIQRQISPRKNGWLAAAGRTSHGYYSPTNSGMWAKWCAIFRYCI